MSDDGELQDLDIDDPRAIEALAEGDPPEEDWFIVEGELPEEELSRPVPTCPNPTKWRQTSSAVKATGRWIQVSSGVWAKAAPVRHTFHAERSVTWGVAVEESLKGSIKLIEAELKISLDTHTTLTTSETLSYTVPKGKVMALFAAPAYVVRRFQRTVYSSAGPCYPVTQSCRTSSPVQHILKVDNVG